MISQHSANLPKYSKHTKKSKMPTLYYPMLNLHHPTHTQIILKQSKPSLHSSIPVLPHFSLIPTKSRILHPPCRPNYYYFTTMSRRYNKQAEKQLIDIVNSRSNVNKCGECGSDYPTWASWNLGILLCGRCANIHKKILQTNGPRGGPISKVKSLTLESWSDDQIDLLRRIGNKKAKQRWNPKKVPFPHDYDDSDAPVEQWMRDKYILQKFRYDLGEMDDADDKFSRYSNDSGALTPAGRSRLSTLTGGRLRSNTGQIPRLLHRKLTQFEQTQFSSQLDKILGFGYTDRDAVLESLILSRGDILFALDILDHDSKVNPTLAELPPDLPKRPSTAGVSSASNSGAPQVTATTSSEWWNSQTASQSSSQNQTGVQLNGQPQIYQYTDPITGQVSYIDSNGQQYLDPNNPQHQQMLMQQTNPQLIAQQTNKQNILSLYNQPDNFTTNVAVSTSQMQQQQQQPMQMQQPMQQIQQPLQQQMQPAQTGFQYAQGQVYMQPGQTGMYGQQTQYGQPQQQYWR